MKKRHYPKKLRNVFIIKKNECLYPKKWKNVFYRKKWSHVFILKNEGTSLYWKMKERLNSKKWPWIDRYYTFIFTALLDCFWVVFCIYRLSGSKFDIVWEKFRIKHFYTSDKIGKNDPKTTQKRTHERYITICV